MYGTCYRGITQFYLPPTRLSTSGTNHTCLYSPARPAEGRRLSWPGWLSEILRWFVRRRRSPIPVRARRRVTSLLRPTTLPLRHAATAYKSSVVCLSVCQSVCQSVCHDREPCKNSYKPVDIPFQMLSQSQVGSENSILDDCVHLRYLTNMIEPSVKITLTTHFSSSSSSSSSSFVFFYPLTSR